MTSGKAAHLGMRLDALDQVAIVDSALHGRRDVQAIRTVQVRIVVALQAADEIRRQEGDDAGPCLLDSEVTKRGQRDAAWAALVNQRRNA
jgi:hypothetical protein